MGRSYTLPRRLISPCSLQHRRKLMFVVTTTIIVGMILLAGVIFSWLHSLPERVAHKSKKIQFEIVAILGLLSFIRTSISSGLSVCCSPL